MTAAVRRRSPMLKVKIAIMASESGADLDEIAKVHDVSKAEIRQWRAQLSRNAAAVFETNGPAEACGNTLSFDPKAPSAPDLVGITFPARHSFGQSIGYWGRILEMLYTREFVLQMRPARASTAVWRVLAWLVELDTVTVGQLVAHTQIERTVLSRLVDRMASQGLISRMNSVSDRRIVLLRITSKGRAAYDKMRPIRMNIYGRATRGIDQRYIDFAREVIIKMVDNLGGRASLFPAEPPRSAKAQPGRRGKAHRRIKEQVAH